MVISTVQFFFLLEDKADITDNTDSNQTLKQESEERDKKPRKPENRIFFKKTDRGRAQTQTRHFLETLFNF